MLAPHEVRIASEVVAERRRQQDAEGWTPQHDDQHDGGEMACAAAVYCISAALPGERQRAFSRYWPWERGAFKPAEARRDLIRAAALIVAEIERLDRRCDDAEAARFAWTETNPDA
jgi:hypothetical protein